jgi:hypothetical protein
MFEPFRHDNPVRAARWQTVLNGAGEQIPAWGLVKISASDVAGVFTGQKPATDGERVWIAAGMEINTDEQGSVTADFPAWALYDEADGTPAIGETWGAGASSFKLRKDKAGFRVCGDPDTTLRIVPVELSIAAASGSLTVAEADGSPSVSSVTQLQVDQVDGCVISSPGAGIARLDLLPATWFQAGIVSTTDQSWHGWKTSDGAFRAGLIYPVQGFAYAGVFSRASLWRPTIESSPAFPHAPSAIMWAPAYTWPGLVVADGFSGGSVAIHWSGAGFPSGMDFWLHPGTYNFNGQLYNGRLVSTGRYAYFNPSANLVYTGYTANVNGLDFQGGIYVGGTITGLTIDGGSF